MTDRQREGIPRRGTGPAYDTLDHIANVLTGTNPLQAEWLWAVLTALRGPDFELNSKNVQLKIATTAVIRYTLARRSTVRVPEVAVEELADNCGVVIRQDNEDLAHIRREIGAVMDPGPMQHFVHHARKAFIALGLKWGEVNR